MAGTAYAQWANQPGVSIVENTITYQITPVGTYNITLEGYINVSNPSATSSLFNVNLTYATPPSPYNISEERAQYFNASGGPFAASNANMLTPGIIHVNEIPAGYTYQIFYMINATNASSGTAYDSFPQILNGTEQTYLHHANDSASTWTLLNLAYNSSIGYYTDSSVKLYSNDTVSFVVQLNDSGYGAMTNMRLQKQLPVAQLPSTGNATFAITNSSYWSAYTSNIPYTNTTGGTYPNNYYDVSVTSGTQSISTNDAIKFQINGTLSNVSGNTLPPGSAFKYVNFSYATFTFNVSDTGHSYLGALIDNASSSWITSGGDASFDIEKAFNTDLQQWSYDVLVTNPTDISFNLTHIAVYRDPTSSSPDYVNALSTTPVLDISPNYQLDPGQTYDTGLQNDAGYTGGSDSPPVYWVTFSWSVNAAVVGGPANYNQSIIVTSSNPGNVTLYEPAIGLSTWKLYVNKNATYNAALGAYVVNITIQNIGFAPTPSNIRVFDFIPDRFNASSFFMNGVSHDPDYNSGAMPLNGPRTIGWNVGVLNPSQVANMSYYAFGNASEYYSTGLYVIGADPSQVEGATAGGSGSVTSGVASTAIGLVMVNLIGLTVLLGLYRRFK